MKFKLLPLVLNLFEGDGSGDGSGASGAMGETNGSSANTQQSKKGSLANVVYGKQSQPVATGDETENNSPSPSQTSVTSNTIEDKRKAFHDMISGEYKDFYTEETQRIIDRRFKDTKNLESKVNSYQPIIDMLTSRYGVDDMGKLLSAIEDDDAYWAEAAEAEGMSVEQYKQFQKLQRENKALIDEQKRRQNEEQVNNQVQIWTQEAEQLKTMYPDFDLAKELANPQFKSLLTANVGMQHAYEVAHLDDIKMGVAQQQARTTAKQVTDNIRAKGNRPAENGASSNSAFTVKDDVHKLTKKDRAEIARRAMRGEAISF